ncbi:MAG TPA: hypothetical protein VLT56_00925 [Desulfobacterales bacterium]|jgi:hypothetical protein|nr:hypothetical protein [Desulfobacterales bacterium]
MREPEADMSFPGGSRALQLFENQTDSPVSQELLRLVMAKKNEVRATVAARV